MCCNIEQASLTYGKIREYLHIFTGIYFTNNVTITICVWTNDETEDFFGGELIGIHHVTGKSWDV